MKCALLAIAICVLFTTACTKKSSAVQTIATINMKDSSKANTDADSVFLRGIIIPSTGEAANGVVRIIKIGGSYKLDLDSFITTPGPDLHVYLSKEANPVHIIDLGNLQLNRGYQRYSIITPPDFTKFRYVTIHCQQFNVVFGYALLQ